MMVAAISETASTNPPNPKISSRQQDLHNPSRPPLLPSEKDNGLVVSRRPRGKQVSSRYMSPSPSTSTSTSTTTTSSSSTSSRRFPSPLISRSTNSKTLSSTPLPSSVLKRSQSVDRRRPVTPRPTTPLPDSRLGSAGGEVSASTKLLITSTRSLSVSFQAEAFSLPISKTKPSLSGSRKDTPERRRTTPLRGKDIDGGGGDQVENSKPADQHRWPAARTRQTNLGSNVFARSVDFSRDKKKLNGIGSGLVVRSLQQSIMDESRRGSFDGRLSLDLGNADVQNPDASSVIEPSFRCDLTASDTDSVSSGSTSGVQDSGGVVKGKSMRQGIAVSARFWQETNSRLRRLQDPGSPLPSSPSSRGSGTANLVKKFASDNPLSSPRTMASPIRGTTRPASPSKLWTSSSSSQLRGMSSPSRVRNLVGGSLSHSYSGGDSTPSILSFSVDIRRGKIGEDRIVDAHTLRLLYNHYLQWRLVNARADATFMSQKLNTEKNIWNAWVTISQLRHSATLKRIKLLLLRQKLKLTSIFKAQCMRFDDIRDRHVLTLEKLIAYLEGWALLDRDHSSSLEGATEALKASTLRLPVVGKTVADNQNLKDAISSAVHVMQAMASSICSLSLKVEDMNLLMAELVKVTAKEKFMLEHCTAFLSSLAGMQVKDCSLRTHIIQLNHLSTTRSCLTTHV